jgi:hypothetical protein
MTVDSSILIELAKQWDESAEQIEEALIDNDCASRETLEAITSGVDAVKACAAELRLIATTGRLP